MSWARLEPLERWVPLFEREGIASVADVIERAECVRDLPDRANLRLDLAGRLVHVKLAKSGDAFPRPPACVPAPEVVFVGYDPDRGAVLGTLDVSPARPVDDLLREGALSAQTQQRLLRSLAHAVADLHQRGLRHRDLYLNHVYVDPARGDPLVAIIDWDRLGTAFRALGRRTAKDLAALMSSIPADTVHGFVPLRFLVLYLRRRELRGRRRVRRFLRRVDSKVGRIRRHRPRTPVGDAARPEGGRLA